MSFNLNSSIQFNSVGKKYFKQGQRTFKELLHGLIFRHESLGEFIWALKDISFDIKNGTEIKYYNSGKIFEKYEWIKGVQDRKYLRYYENGNVMIRSTYLKGILNGIYASYTIDNKPIVTGNYDNNLREGIWIFYDETGREKQKINYIDGVAENQEELDKLEQYEIDQLEKNKGNISEPTEDSYNPPM